jgi:hypothetical protein
MLRLELGIGCADIELLTSNTWVLIDDAYLASAAERFWKIAVKDFTRCDRPNIVIAATYDLMSQSASPYTFGEHGYITDLMLTSEEAEDLHDGYIKGILFAKMSIVFKAPF